MSICFDSLIVNLFTDFEALNFYKLVAILDLGLCVLDMVSCIHGCFRPARGVMRDVKSQSKQFSTKSINEYGAPDKAYARILVPGYRIEPSVFVCTIGLSFSSKNFSFRVDIFKICCGGVPSVSMISASCSASLSPGKRGTPVMNSTSMTPRDHISIAVVYGMPSMISGAL